MPAMLRAALALVACASGASALASEREKQKHLGAQRVNVSIKQDRKAWIEATAKPLAVDHLKLDGKRPEDLTALVTFAGQKKTEYLDAAVMLAHSLKKHAPGHPLVAIAIKGMAEKDQMQLIMAGWQLVFVENWEDEYCQNDCNQEFMKRWHDSFEKINIFRLGFGRVLFFDADTYVFNGRVKELLLATRLKKGHIAMAPDGCKNEYNSGVMLFRPDVEVFRHMLELVSTRSREQVLDQNIINAAYAGKIKELDREFNCVDIMGVQPGMGAECMKKCSDDVVVAHFTGHPKPTAAKRRLLEMVRKPESPGTTCKNTNFGSCKKWSEYYCDIRKNSKTLSKNLQGWLKKTGDCCHTPYDPSKDAASCQRCPLEMHITGEDAFPQGAKGTFRRSNIASTKYNGGKPIYVKSAPGQEPVYLYYVQPQVLWMVGTDYSRNVPYAYALLDAVCPRDVQKWQVSIGGAWTWVKDVQVRPTMEANVTHASILFDAHLDKWVPDEGVHTSYVEDFD